MAKPYLYDWSIVCDDCDAELNFRGSGFTTPNKARLDAEKVLEQAIDSDAWSTDGVWLHCPECPKPGDALNEP